MRFRQMHLWMLIAIVASIFLPTSLGASPPAAGATSAAATVAVTETTVVPRKTVRGRPVARMGECDPPGEPRQHWWPKSLRQETHARVQRACRDMGGSPIICAYMDLIVERESHGRAGVRHHRGKNENGLGPMGLSKHWQAGRWPGKDEEPMFCQPEASAIVAQALFYRAFDHYSARTVAELQSIYAGKWFCYRENGRRRCEASQRYYSRGHLCSQMKARGFSCKTKLTRSDLGRRFKRADRRTFVEEQIAKGVPAMP